MVKVIVDTSKPRAARLWQKSTFPCKTRFCKDCASNIFFCFAISLLNNLLAFCLRIEIVPFPCKPMFVGYYLSLSLSYFLFYILIDTIWKENLLLYLLVLLSFHVLEKYTVKYAIRTFSRCSRSAIYRLIIESIFIPRKFESYDISSSIFFFFLNILLNYRCVHMKFEVKILFSSEWINGRSNIKLFNSKFHISNQFRR